MRSDTPLISVIIPTYNRAALLDDALESVIAQTYGNWECIVVDDGSTDATKEVVGRYGDRVHYYWQENAGSSAARNHGIEKASGEQFLFLDSDDLLCPDALEVLSDGLRRHPDAGISYGGFAIVLPDGQRVGRRHVGVPVLSSETDEEGVTYGLSAAGTLLTEVLQHDVMLMGNTLIRRSGVEAIGGFDPSLPHREHWDFALRLADRGEVFVPVNTRILLHRRHEANKSLNTEASLAHRLDKIEEYLPQEGEGRDRIRERAYATAYMSAAQSDFYQYRLRSALSYLREAFSVSCLSLARYLDDLNLFADRLCSRVQSTETPVRTLSDLLSDFTETPNQRAFRHLVWGRFWRIRARRSRDVLRWSRPKTWRSGGRMILSAHRVFYHLARATSGHRDLARPLLRRLKRRVRGTVPVPLVGS